MRTQKTMLAVALMAIATAAAADYDGSAAKYFAYAPTVAAAGAQAKVAVPQRGEVTDNGLSVYSGSDRGWVAAAHSYVFVAGKLEHAPNCLAYNAPNALKGPVNPKAEHA